MSAEDFPEFSKDIMEEFKIRKRIHQLQEWRKNGITKFADGERYEKERANRVARFSMPSNGTRHSHTHSGRHSRSISYFNVAREKMVALRKNLIIHGQKDMLIDPVKRKKG